MNELSSVVFNALIIPLICIAGLFVSTLVAILIADILTEYKDEINERRRKNGKDKK